MRDSKIPPGQFWRPPDLGWIKINTDGAINSEEQDQSLINLTAEVQSDGLGPLTMVLVGTSKSTVPAEVDVHSSDSSKKLRISPSRSADLAEAAGQPRHTQ